MPKALIEHPNAVFVFGSNRAGRHGKGAALYAKKVWGAVEGKGYGHHGRSYAIPTKDEELQTLGLPEIAQEIDLFYDFAGLNPELFFLISPLGTGLAGYSKRNISRQFQRSVLPANLLFLKDWFEL